MTATRELMATIQKLKGLSNRWWEQDCLTAVMLGTLAQRAVSLLIWVELIGINHLHPRLPGRSKRRKEGTKYWRPGSSHALAFFSRVPRQAEGQEVSGAQLGCDLPHRKPHKWPVTSVVLCLGFSELWEHLGIGESLPGTSADKVIARFYLPLTLVK